MMILSVFPGCNNKDNNTYQTFTFTKGIKFSFEYPSYYYKDRIWAYKSGTSAGGVDFFDKLPSDWYWYDHIDLRVESSNKSSHEAIEEIVNNKLTKEIIERSNVTMAGMQGEMLVYSFKASLPERNQLGWSCAPRKINTPSDPNNVFEIDRIAYFSDGNHLWWVESGWSESKAEQQKADLDHIFRTFKIRN
jgi:hypothetical protein